MHNTPVAQRSHTTVREISSRERKNSKNSTTVPNEGGRQTRSPEEFARPFLEKSRAFLGISRDRPGERNRLTIVWPAVCSPPLRRVSTGWQSNFTSELQRDPMSFLTALPSLSLSLSSPFSPLRLFARGFARLALIAGQTRGMLRLLDNLLGDATNWATFPARYRPS